MIDWSTTREFRSHRLREYPVSHVNQLLRNSQSVFLTMSAKLSAGKKKLHGLPSSSSPKKKLRASDTLKYGDVRTGHAASTAGVLKSAVACFDAVMTAAEEPLWGDLTATDAEADNLESIFCYFAQLVGGGGIAVNKSTGLVKME
jgi:hypothetical protein